MRTTTACAASGSATTRSSTSCSPLPRAASSARRSTGRACSPMPSTASWSSRTCWRRSPSAARSRTDVSPRLRAAPACLVAEPIVARVNDNVVRLGTSVVNWYLLADAEGVTVVDAALPAYRTQLGAGLRELGRTLPDVKAILLTHAHADHVGFAEQLRQELDIPVYVHRDDEQLATSAKQFGKTDVSMFPYFRYPAAYRLMFEMLRGGGAKSHPIERVTRFGDAEELPVPGRPRTIHTPGHSPGHTALVAADTLFAGDALCTQNPLTGKRGPQLMPSAFNASTDQALASLDRLVGSGASVLLPGHGPPVREPNSAVDEAKRRGPT